MGCSCEIYGKQLVYPGGGVTFYTMPESRKGGSAIFIVDALTLNSTGPLAVSVDHKNTEDTSWTALGAFAGISTTGVSTKYLSGIKEQIRFAVTFGAGSAAGDSASIKQGISWFPY